MLLSCEKSLTVVRLSGQLSSRITPEPLALGIIPSSVWSLHANGPCYPDVTLIFSCLTQVICLCLHYWVWPKPILGFAVVLISLSSDRKILGGNIWILFLTLSLTSNATLGSQFLNLLGLTLFICIMKKLGLNSEAPQGPRERIAPMYSFSEI